MSFFSCHSWAPIKRGINKRERERENTGSLASPLSSKQIQINCPNAEEQSSVEFRRDSGVRQMTQSPPPCLRSLLLFFYFLLAFLSFTHSSYINPQVSSASLFLSNWHFDKMLLQSHAFICGNRGTVRPKENNLLV